MPNLSVTDEELQKTSTVMKMLPKAPSRATIWRWVHKGKPNRNGEMVKLEVVHYLGQQYTTFTAVKRFLDATGGRKSPGRTAKRKAQLKSVGLA